MIPKTIRETHSQLYDLFISHFQSLGVLDKHKRLSSEPTHYSSVSTEPQNLCQVKSICSSLVKHFEAIDDIQSNDEFILQQSSHCSDLATSHKTAQLRLRKNKLLLNSLFFSTYLKTSRKSKDFFNSLALLLGWTVDIDDSTYYFYRPNFLLTVTLDSIGYNQNQVSDSSLAFSWTCHQSDKSGQDETGEGIEIEIEGFEADAQLSKLIQNSTISPQNLLVLTKIICTINYIQDACQMLRVERNYLLFSSTNEKINDLEKQLKLKTCSIPWCSDWCNLYIGSNIPLPLLNSDSKDAQKPVWYFPRFPIYIPPNLVRGDSDFSNFLFEPTTLNLERYSKLNVEDLHIFTLYPGPVLMTTEYANFVTKDISEKPVHSIPSSLLYLLDSPIPSSYSTNSIPSWQYMVLKDFTQDMESDLKASFQIETTNTWVPDPKIDIPTVHYGSTQPYCSIKSVFYSKTNLSLLKKILFYSFKFLRFQNYLVKIFAFKPLEAFSKNISQRVGSFPPYSIDYVCTGGNPLPFSLSFRILFLDNLQLEMYSFEPKSLGFGSKLQTLIEQDEEKCPLDHFIRLYYAQGG